MNSKLRIRRLSLSDKTHYPPSSIRVLASKTPEGVYNEKMKALSQEEILVKNQLKQAKDKNYKAETTLEQIKNTFLCANKAEKAYCEAKDDTRRELVKTLLWNISIKEQKIASYRLKMPYQLLIGGPKITDFSTLHKSTTKLEPILSRISPANAGRPDTSRASRG